MKVILSVFTLLVLSSLTTVAQACSCGYGGYWVSEFVEDKVIFEGQALQSTWKDNISLSPFRHGTVETKFITLKSLRGPGASEILVLHDSYDGASCGINYALGGNYTVIASYKDDEFLSTSSCSSNAIPEITLLEYFETNTDVYIPPSWDCSDEQINDPNDPKNCYFLSEEAAKERREKMEARWQKEWDERRAAMKASQVDAQQK